MKTTLSDSVTASQVRIPERYGTGIYSSFVERLILPFGDFALRTSVTRKLREYRELQWRSRWELERVQSERLRSLLAHAKRNIPFFGEIGFDEAGDPRDEIRKFPILTKPIVRENLEALVAGDKKRLIETPSSGSSGVQGVVYYDRHELSTERAIQLLWLEWTGYRAGVPVVQTGMTLERGLVKIIKDRVFRTDYFAAFRLEAGTILGKLREIREAKGRIRHLMGYASSLYLFARTARDHGLDDITFDSVVSWGDKMFPHYRALIEAQFGTQVFDTYGCTEGCMIAAQCERGSYHIMSPQVYLEILDPNGNPVEPGELGSVVVTRLDNYSMPLIRYYLGDLAGMEPAGTSCDCGRHLPLLRKMIGRDTDIVRTRSGKQMIVHFFTGILEHYPEIRQFRVVQRTLDEIEIECVPGPGFSPEVTARIRAQITGHLGEEFGVNFREVGEIPVTASGKPQIVVSMLAQEQGAARS